VSLAKNNNDVLVLSVTLSLRSYYCKFTFEVYIFKKISTIIIIRLLHIAATEATGYTGWLKKSKLLYCVNSLLFLSHPV